VSSTAGSLAFLIGVLTAAALGAEDLTLPAVASLVGGNPFFSDVRVFNTSYTDSLEVIATYRCFLPTAQAQCPASPPTLNLTLAPRESKAFDDMVASADGFDSHDTGGAVEFEHAGSSGQLVVTSRLFSTSPQNSVGMFIPGLENSAAHSATVLTSIRHSADFRTNVGLYNREDSGVSVTFTIFDGGSNPVGNPVTRSVGGHAGLQVSGIFEAAGAGSVDTQNAVIVVAASGEIFSYAAVLDNRTADPIFVVGAKNEPAQTPIPVTPTPTRVSPTPTATRTPPPQVRIVRVEFERFWDTADFSTTSEISVGTKVRWMWIAANQDHSTTSGPCPPCTGDGIWDSGTQDSGQFERTFQTPGVFPYYCILHGSMGMKGKIVVNP
jgi:hypothetical protein